MRIFSGRAAKANVDRLASRGAQRSALEPRVRRIVNDVRRRGDSALRKYAERWDGLASRQSLRVSAAELEEAFLSLQPDLKKSLRLAAQNIRQFCEWQKPETWTRTRSGIALGQLIRPLESVGCYVPGGRYPLVSTLLMTVIPAQVAGVKRTVVVSPKPSPQVMAAAAMLGVREFYRVGGAQAIAALAYGTETIARVDKIVGPGNAYVTAAKNWSRSTVPLIFWPDPPKLWFSAIPAAQTTSPRTWSRRRSMIRPRLRPSSRPRANWPNPWPKA